MRKTTIVWLLITSQATLANAAAAVDESVSASKPNSVVDLARGYGSASLSKDDDGDPLVKARINGIAYSIYFYGCEQHLKCTTVQLHSGFVVDPKINLKVVNEWNRTRRWTKAFADKDGDPILSMDIPTLDGLPRDTLDELFSFWSKEIKEYSDYIGFKP
jgi:Putative bacterial sensory transduction regulator